MSEVQYVKQCDSAKIEKNSRGYNWEIKVIGTNKDGTISPADLNRLDLINKEFSEKYEFKI